MKKITRNPSFTPSPALRAYIDNSEAGPTGALNKLYDTYAMIVQMDAIRLTEDEQAALKSMLHEVLVDGLVIQSVPKDVIETGCPTLIEKMNTATVGQTIATLTRYKLI
jgi:hypothetical protein